MAKLCKLIDSSMAISALQIQETLNISRRTMFRYLDELRDLGAIITYNKSTNSYHLEEEFDVLQSITEIMV